METQEFQKIYDEMLVHERADFVASNARQLRMDLELVPTGRPSLMSLETEDIVEHLKWDREMSLTELLDIFGEIDTVREIVEEDGFDDYLEEMFDEENIFGQSNNPLSPDADLPF